MRQAHCYRSLIEVIELHQFQCIQWPWRTGQRGTISLVDLLWRTYARSVEPTATKFGILVSVSTAWFKGQP